jgi:galactofuranose transport system substrate-binding protein
MKNWKKDMFRMSAMLIILCILFFFFWFWGTESRNSISKEDEIKYVIGVSQANMREDWRLALMAELEKEMLRHKDIRIITTDATTSVTKQKQDIDRLLDFGIDLLIVSPCDTKAMTDKIKEVYDNNIPVIVMDRAIEGFDYTLYIGPDNEVIGRQAGNFIGERFGAMGCTVLELSGKDMAIQSEERSEGFDLAIEDHPGIVKKISVMDNELRDTAYDYLLKKKEVLQGVDVIFAHNDYIALGAYEALVELGLDKEIQIVGSDGFTGKNEGIDLVMSNKITATISCPTGGKEAIEYALNILKKESGVPKQVILRSYTITSDNAAVYLEKLNTIWEANEEEIVVGYSQVGQESQWRLANTKSIKEAAEAFQVKLLFEDANQQQENQFAAIRKFIKEDVDVIVVSPVVEDGWEEILREAKDAGIPVVMSDRNVKVDITETDLITTYIGADFMEEGRRAMRWVRDNVPSENSEVKILEIQGNEGASPTEERKKGFEETLQESEGYRIVYSANGDFTTEGGKRVIEQYLKERAWDINVIYCHNDDMALGAIEVLEDHGIKPGVDVKIVSVDGTKAAFQAMAQGKLNCAVECNPMLGNQLMKAVRDLVSGKQMPLRIITDERIYDQKQAEDLIKTRVY